MAAADYERAVQLSVLDRLIDLEPDVRAEANISRAESLRRLRTAIRRDLEWLLNTVRSNEPPPALRELKNSLYTYGIPDITSMSLESGHDAQRLLRSLESTISLFEPRLANVRVTSNDQISRKRMSIEFHIEALLLIDPAPERLSFDTVFEVARGFYKVEEH
jgi:type VI secretion system protein ImpF